ncbi:MAG: anaerobic sulfatase maturase [Johnsonella sp.]|nr:anaerobic sulfatase maturase [Johnsonella sp.]
MPPVNILIKPASSACNMACTYCFYRDVSQNRAEEFQGMLSQKLIEDLLREALSYADIYCSFTFQGGEPTLAGIDFYKKFIELVKVYNHKKLKIYFSLQTNGYLINESWAEFFSEHRFLIGLSLDGPAKLHNPNRIDHQGKGTWSKVLHASKLFDQYEVSYNILSVLTGENSRYIEQIYGFYKKNNFKWLQFIPCIDPFDCPDKSSAYSLSDKRYGEFLVRIFDLWFEDLKKGHYTSIRHIDNLIYMLSGREPEACNMRGVCGIQFVIEGDGGIYPCDFFVLDQWRLGTLGQSGFSEIMQSQKARDFIEESMHYPQECKNCPHFYLCRNGCKRERKSLAEGGKNIYCNAYKHFFSEREAHLRQALEICRRYRAF